MRRCMPRRFGSSTVLLFVRMLHHVKLWLLAGDSFIIAVGYSRWMLVS